MAESLPQRGVGGAFSNVRRENSVAMECAVCLQSCVHPAELPCGHVFCYLCIKGIVNRNRRCAMCRQSIPADFLEKPRLLRPVQNDSDLKGFEDGHSWFYEGHNGWWQYDERTSSELESAYQSGERLCEIQVAGYVYVADFDSMLQYRRNDTCKRRRIKRDLTSTTKKGVAGLKLPREGIPGTSSNIVSNILIPGMENLHISNRSADMGNQPPNVFRIHNDIREHHDHEASSYLARGHAVEPLRPVYRQEPVSPNPTDSDADSDDNLYMRAAHMRGRIHNDLSWNAQQMESMNSQMSNDFDNLTDDFDDDYDDQESAVSGRNESTSSENDMYEGNENIQGLESDRSQDVSPYEAYGYQRNEDTASQDSDPDE